MGHIFEYCTSCPDIIFTEHTTRSPAVKTTKSLLLSINKITEENNNGTSTSVIHHVYEAAGEEGRGGEEK